MLDLKLYKTGTIKIEHGKIEIEDFGAKDAMCREVAALAMLWAIGELQKELTAVINQPGGTGISSVD